MEINTYNDSNFLITISNIPGVDMSNMWMFDNYIRSIDVPGLGLGAYDEFIDMRSKIVHPMHGARYQDLADATLTIKLSENLLNYFYLMRYVQTLRTGINNEDQLGTQLVENKIREIKVTFLDNQKREIGYYTLNGAIITNLMNMTLSYDSTSTIDFNVTLKYESFDIDIKDVK